MKAKMIPMVDASDLEQALCLQYGESFMEDIDDNISAFLFGEEYMNDVCKKYFFDEIEEYTGKPWQNEERIRIQNCIKTFLQDTFPGMDCILIDVSW